MSPKDIFAESDAFERFMGRWSRRLAPLLVKFASVGERDSVLDVGSRHPFLGGQGPAGAYTASLPEQKRAALETRLRTRLLGTRGDGPFTLQARAWAVKDVVPGTLTVV